LLALTSFLLGLLGLGFSWLGSGILEPCAFRFLFAAAAAALCGFFFQIHVVDILTNLSSSEDD
jgi:hypothetical protein